MNSNNDYSTHYFGSSLSLANKIDQLIKVARMASFKPCLLLSKCEPNTSAQFSYLLANPTQSSLTAPCLGSSPESLFNSDAGSETQHIPLHSGWVGYYAYPDPHKEAPASEFHYYPWAICLDHNTGKFHLLGSPDTNAKDLFSLLSGDPATEPNLKEPNGKEPNKKPNKELKAETANLSEKTNSFKASRFKPAWSKAQYQQAFASIQHYLKAGDCYQVNLTQPHKASYTGCALDTLAPLYAALNPSYGAYFAGRDCELVSVSPERFMSISATGRLEAKPIKGTIKRSEDPTQDQLYIDELKNSAKNQAENLMIVDLLRNDLSISALPNSVKVEKLFELETHPNVHHLVSTISAQLRPELTPADAILNAFPGGSITGAPKKRAMEIIDELEAQPRSLYCGSFGYYSDTGHVDFNILIRSVEFRDGEMTCWGGGGITVDSDCEEEYEESLTKVRKIMEVIENI